MSDRIERAHKTIKTYMWWSAGAGLIPVPVVDLLAISGLQLKMISDISRLYEVPFHEYRGKAIIASLMGFVLPHATACGMIGSLLKAVPLVGALAGAPAMSIFSAASAWALGNVFIQHFESGGTFLDFDPEKVKVYYKKQFEEGKLIATNVTPGHESGASV